jgi:hypothetical protein
MIISFIEKKETKVNYVLILLKKQTTLTETR